MRRSEYYIPTLKAAPQDAQSASHKLIFRAGLARMLSAGVYLYLPLGLRVLDNIMEIIREEMNAKGACEVLLSALQPVELWRASGRDELMGQTMIRYKDRRDRDMALGPTHEEVITYLAKMDINSYRDLPVILYQIQTKFRDELRPRFGLIRCCEFIMKDAYSFDLDEKGLDISYKKMFAAYNSIFSRMGLTFSAIEADTGVMGGSESAEFLAPAPCGEDILCECAKCKRKFGVHDGEGQNPVCECGSTDVEKIPAIEVGHIFKLGTKYTDVFDFSVLDKDGVKKRVIMGCYGIGVSRLISTIIEQHNDEKGIIWPKEVSPFDVALITANVEPATTEAADRAYKLLQDEGFDVLYDDRDARAGVKFNDADLIGIPIQVIAGKAVKDGKLEIKDRRNGQINAVPINGIAEAAKKLCQQIV